MKFRREMELMSRCLTMNEGELAKYGFFAEFRETDLHQTTLRSTQPGRAADTTDTR